MKHIKVQVGSSMYAYNIFDNSIENVFTAWNNITPNIVVYNPSSSAPNNAFPVMYQGSIDFAKGSQMAALTTPYDENGNIAYSGGVLAYVIIKFNFRSDSPWLEESYSNDTKKAVVLHELGHALMLKHPKDNDYVHPSIDSDELIVSIMNHGTYETNLSYTVYPSFFDRVNLINRWS